MQCLSRTFGQRDTAQPALRPGDDHRRCSDRLQVLSWTAGPVRGDNVQAVANRIDVLWHVVCIQEGVGFTADRTLSDNFHVAVARHCAVLLNKDTFEDDYTCTPIQVPCNQRYSSWALDGMVVSGKFGRPLDLTCRFSTVATVHINNECAARRSVRVALLLLPRDLCLKQGRVPLVAEHQCLGQLAAYPPCGA